MDENAIYLHKFSKYSKSHLFVYVSIILILSNEILTLLIDLEPLEIPFDKGSNCSFFYPNHPNVGYTIHEQMYYCRRYVVDDSM